MSRPAARTPGPWWAAALVALWAGQAFGGAAVTIEEADLLPSPGAAFFAKNARPAPPDPALPLVAAPGPDAAGLLRRLWAEGRAAGFDGVLYDNRDRGHSTLDPALFPALAHIEYARELRKRGLDVGLAGAIQYPAIVFGNASMAVTRGDTPRSLPRMAMTQAGLPDRAYRLYAANALYVYPEHRDHDARDLFPANWPYMVISQGSSGSDQPFLEALAMTLAALPPGTRTRLEKAGLIAPALQMILRRSLAPVTTRAAYLSPAAHPPVFSRDDLRPGRMISLAAALTPETIAPMVRLEVGAEDFAAASPDQRSERLYDTPSAIARIWRADAGERQMTVSVADTFDPNGRPLTFSWVLLSGDPRHVTIEPVGPNGAQAQIRLTWHDPGAAGPTGRPPSGRIDIGVFAWNGAQDSAPAMISVLLPLHEGREFTQDPEGAMRLTGRTPRPEYKPDPQLFPDAPQPDN